MKMNYFTKYCYAAIVVCCTMSMASCDNHDFDFDKARNENVEYQFEQNFQKLYGTVDPTQNWDFAEEDYIVGSPISLTLADGSVYEVKDGAANLPTTRAGEYAAVKLKDEWFDIPNATLQWFKTYLPEGTNQKNNTDLGSSFAMYVPGSKFSITPMYQGQHGLGWLLKVQFIEPNGTTYTTDVWTNGQYMQKKTSNNGQWKNLTPGSNNTNWPNTLDAIAIHSKTLHFENVPAGTVVIFNLYISQGSGSYATTGTSQLSTNNMMRALNIPAASQPTTMPIDYGEYNNRMIMACEDANLSGSDWDYNDVVFLVNGLIPQSVSDETIPVTKTRRYMVEDMGYSDKNSQAVNKGYTDIDFNDIVVDFSRTVRTKYYYRNGVLDRTEVVSTEYSSKVVALGGTWDFKLFVGNDVVFQKSKANQYITYNSNYKIGQIAINSINVGTMYNTNRATDQNGDGNYNTGYHASNGYLGTLKSNKIRNWDPDTHNIKFEIVDDGTYGTGNKNDLNSSSDNGNVYTISFPAKGVMPKIAAFLDTKVWNAERVAVDKTFFSTSATWEQ